MHVINRLAATPATYARRALTLGLAAAVLGAAPAPAAPTSFRDQPRVTDAEEDEFLAAIEARDAVRLRRLFEDRIATASPVAQVRLTPAEDLLNGLEGCRQLRVQRFGDDPDIFVQWVCPGRPRNGEAQEVAGYVAHLWHAEFGLTVMHGPHGVHVSNGRTPRPPSPPR